MSKISVFLFLSILIGLVNLALITQQPNFSFFGSNSSSNKQSKKASETKGMLVFNTYCVLCHGEKGDGNGRLAVGKIPPPANLTMTILNDEQLKAIIEGGGPSVGRSEFMPPWRDELSDSQIQEVIQYINALRTK